MTTSNSTTSEPHEFFVDPGRCIGCQSCVQACTECDTHKGVSMIQLDVLDRQQSPQTAPTVCMHCESPTCAEVCPADAIKRTDDGVVLSARKPRCIACNNCVLACPFGIPKMNTRSSLMMKCDMCFDRTSEGLAPMCASVCPSGALHWGPRSEIEAMRPRSKPVDAFQFGDQPIRTKVKMMVPRQDEYDRVDVLGALRDGSADEAADGDALLANMYDDGH